MLANVPPALPPALAKIVSVAIMGITFVVVLFLKLCYSTALFATLAEITRRIALFRQGKRPAVRALLLLPVVVLFCSAVLFALNLIRLFGAGYAKTSVFFIFLGLRIVFLFVAVALGAGIGLLLAPRIPMGRDRFGGVIYQNRGRYLAFWLATFSLCGFFRLLPWGFVTYWSIWFLVLAASLVTALHWRLYGRYRNLRLSVGPGLSPGEPLICTLSSSEAVALSVLLQSRSPIQPKNLAQRLLPPDVALLAHPGWNSAVQVLATDAGAPKSTLDSLVMKGLAAGGRTGYSAASAAQRLASIGHVDLAVGLTCKEGGRCSTRVLHQKGPSRILAQIGPETLILRELSSRDDALAALSAP